MTKHLLILPLIMLCFCGCNRLHEAQSVVAEADSLRTEGVMYDDSTRLAEAVAALKPLRLLHPTDYAKANYYYGRLLRNRDNYVAAMQCFIDATESKTDNHEIIACSYSNMGSMCHLDESYYLSSQMYCKSAYHFKQVDDLQSYFFVLNSMAYELVENKDVDSAQIILDYIDHECSDTIVINKTYETKAEMCIVKESYDSAIFYVKQLLNKGYCESTGYVTIAQAFSLMGNSDSATYYATIAYNHNPHMYELNNIYYILSRDETLDRQNILQITSDRADIQKDIENYRSNISKSVQVIKQSMQPKSKIFYFVISLFILIALVVWLWLLRNNRIKKHNIKELNKYIDTYQKQRIHEFEYHFDQIKKSTNIIQTLHWNNYEDMCIMVNEKFFMLAEKLEKLHVLNHEDIKYCILVAIGVTYKQQAQILNLSEKSMPRKKSGIGKKLHVTMKKFRPFLIELACNDTTQ